MSLLCPFEQRTGPRTTFMDPSAVGDAELLLMCETCGLPLPDVPTRGRRLFCTRICRLNKNRYPRAVIAITEIVEAATRSEDLDRPDLAAQEWKALDVALRRLEAMNERIREERTGAGLHVPPNWLGAVPVDPVVHLD